MAHFPTAEWIRTILPNNFFQFDIRSTRNTTYLVYTKDKSKRIKDMFAQRFFDFVLLDAELPRNIKGNLAQQIIPI